jgi:hypothetical protein
LFPKIHILSQHIYIGRVSASSFIKVINLIRWVL